MNALSDTFTDTGMQKAQNHLKLPHLINHHNHQERKKKMRWKWKKKIKPLEESLL